MSLAIWTSLGWHGLSKGSFDKTVGWDWLQFHLLVGRLFRGFMETVISRATFTGWSIQVMKPALWRTSNRAF
jgi:hypothetical protein